MIDLHLTRGDNYEGVYTLAFGQNLVIDPIYWRVTIHGVSLELTRKEFGLLYCLAKHRGQVLTKEQLYRHVWNCESDINLEATIKSHIRTLRRKLHPRGKDYIESIRGVGYRGCGGQGYFERRNQVASKGTGPVG